MKTQIVFSTCALMIGLYGATPAMAESFTDEGLNWAMASPMPTSTSPVKAQALPPDGSFASSWGSGKTPTQYEGRASARISADMAERCVLEAKVEFNQKNNFPTC